MKKLVKITSSVILIAMLALCLVGCGAGTGTGSSGDGSSQAVIKIGGIGPITG